MSEYFPNPIENRKEMILRLVKVAAENALDFYEYSRMEERLKVLIDKDQLSKQEQREEDEILAKADLASVHLKNLADFKIALEFLILNKDTVTDILEHENAHANKGEAIGANFIKYKLTLIQKEGRLIASPSAIFDLDFTDPNIREQLKLITSAPDEYGNRLSDGDMDYLKRNA